MRISSLAFVFVASLFDAMPAHSGSNQNFYCGVKIIDYGVSSYTVQQNCGEPESKQTEQRCAFDQGSGGCSPVEVWTYTNIDQNIYILSFDKGQLVDIKVQRK